MRLSYWEAIDELNKGKKVRRIGWDDDKLFLKMKEQSKVNTENLYSKEYKDAVSNVEAEKVIISRHYDLFKETEGGNIVVIVGWSPDQEDVGVEDYIIVE